MRIGVFGGTFNPVHSGHVRLANEFKAFLSLDRILVIPTCLPPHKTSDALISGDDRLEMCRLAFDDKSFEVSDIELKRGGKSYSYDTLTYLHSLYPNSEFFFIMGTDMLLCFHKWYRYKDLLKLCTPCVAVRDDEHNLDELRQYVAEHEEMEKTIFSHMSAFPVSSTQLREKIANGEDTSGLLPPSVIKYIRDKGLYSVKNHTI